MSGRCHAKSCNVAALRSILNYDYINDKKFDSCLAM